VCVPVHRLIDNHGPHGYHPQLHTDIFIVVRWTAASAGPNAPTPADVVPNGQAAKRPSTASTRGGTLVMAGRTRLALPRRVGEREC
jgi:hypothetical protein